jgi:hypothetical protein
VLNAVRQFLVQAVHIRVLHLPQEVVQLRRHTVMLVANARAQVSEIDQQIEGVSVAFVIACH